MYTVGVRRTKIRGEGTKKFLRGKTTSHVLTGIFQGWEGGGGNKKNFEGKTTSHVLTGICQG